MVSYGGFWWRVLAYIIDGIVLNIVEGVLGEILGIDTLYLFNGFGLNVLGYDSSVFEWGFAGAFNFLLIGLYYSLMTCSKWQATVGKLAVGLVVTDKFGQRISFARAVARFFASFLSAVIFGLGFLMVGWTKRKQGLHDMIAGTLVYKTRDPRQVQNVEGIFS